MIAYTHYHNLKSIFVVCFSLVVGHPIVVHGNHFCALGGCFVVGFIERCFVHQVVGTA